MDFIVAEVFEQRAGNLGKTQSLLSFHDQGDDRDSKKHDGTDLVTDDEIFVKIILCNK